MRLTVDPDERPAANTPHLSAVKFYLCANRACEHAELAPRAA